MTMTEEEIVRHYRQAASKARDIGVLADLNTTDRKTIRAILTAAGEIVPKTPGRRQGTRKKEAEEVSTGSNDQIDWNDTCGRVKQIMDAVPKDIDAAVRRQAGRLCLSILAESIAAALGVEQRGLERNDG